MADFSTIVGNSPAILRVTELLERISQSRDVSVLIGGETGTGKEIVARAIHDNSSTGDELFVEVNCAAIPENLLESELFGYEKGAYTGAERTKPGLFELANGGTLLLDEIGYMSMGLQAKLLKAIEEKTFRRLGGEKEIRVRMRIIASTNVDLENAMRESKFREDLYYRLNEIQLELPPLRERGEDVVLLAEHFLNEFAQQYGPGRRNLAETSKQLLREYHWPGNVRELRNAIKRARIMNDAKTLTPDMIPVSVRSTNSLDKQPWNSRQLTIEIPETGVSFDEVEKQVIAHMLKMTHWNRNKAARMLRISRPRLMRKIEKYHLPAPTTFLNEEDT
ncbi:MAG: sigma-54 dependent transcriptional regulator [bacterium]|nr:sigma-54 dependent transcriptional regulator [bacterium]